MIFTTGFAIILITALLSYVADRIYLPGTRRRRIAGDIVVVSFALGIACMFASVLLKAAEVMP